MSAAEPTLWPGGLRAPRPPWTAAIAAARKGAPSPVQPGGTGWGVVRPAVLRCGTKLALRSVPPLPASAAVALTALCRAWAQVDHPAILPLWAWPCAGAPEAPIVTPWVDGPAPADGSLDAARTAAVLLAALDGLAALHAAGLCHGAIGPRTLRMRPDGGPILLDPGLDAVAAAAATESLALRADRAEDDVRDLLLLASRWLPEDACPLRALLIDPPLAVQKHPARAAQAVAAAVGQPAPPPVWTPSSAPPSPLGFPAEGEGARPVPLVGRATERAALWTAMRRVHAERRPLGVVLRGAPGMGRTALLSAFCAAAAAADLGVSWRALHGPVWGPGQGLLPVVRAALGLEGLSPDALAPLAAVALEGRGLPASARADLLRWLGAAPGPAPGPLQRYDALIALLRAETEACSRAMLLWLDDAQWGPDALCFALHLFARAPDLPVLVLASVRSDPRGTPHEPARNADIAAQLERLIELPEVGELQLGSMGQAELVALLEGPLQLEAATAHRIASWARGMPLAAIQATRALHEADALVAGPDGRALASGDPLPIDLDAVWLDRVHRRLQAQQWSEELTLSAAALLGGIVVDRELDGALSNSGEAADRGLIERLLEGGLVLAHGPGTVRFVHGSLVRALVRRAARVGLARGLHAALAEMLGRRQGASASPTVQARRLRHLLGAEESDKAVDLALVAARSRVLAGEPGPARALLRSVEPLEARLDASDPRRGALWLVHASADALCARGPALRARVARAELEARRRGWPQTRAHALLLLAVIAAQSGATEEAAQALDDAEAVAHALDSAALLALCARERGRCLLLGGQPEAAAATLERAVRLHADNGHPAARAETWRLCALARWQVGQDESAALALGLIGGDAAGWTQAEADLLRGALCAADGDRAGARVAWGRGVAAHRTLGTRSELGGALLLAGWCLDGGDPSGAARYLDAAADDQEAAPPSAKALYRLQRARCALATGRRSTADRWLDDAQAEVAVGLRDRWVAEAATAAAAPLAAGPSRDALRTLAERSAPGPWRLPLDAGESDPREGDTAQGPAPDAHHHTHATADGEPDPTGLNDTRTAHRGARAAAGDGPDPTGEADAAALEEADTDPQPTRGPR